MSLDVALLVSGGSDGPAGMNGAPMAHERLDLT